jgi:hypothetical protein
MPVPHPLDKKEGRRFRLLLNKKLESSVPFFVWRIRHKYLKVLLCEMNEMKWMNEWMNEWNEMKWNEMKWNIFISYQTTVNRYSNNWKLIQKIYKSRKFKGFNNCTLWSIIVVITLGKCAPSGVRERHTCIGLMKSNKKSNENTIFAVEPQ